MSSRPTPINGPRAVHNEMQISSFATDKWDILLKSKHSKTHFLRLDSVEYLKEFPFHNMPQEWWRSVDLKLESIYFLIDASHVLRSL